MLAAIHGLSRRCTRAGNPPLLRLATAGDLPTDQHGNLSSVALAELATAAQGLTPYGYTHAPLTTTTVRALRAALYGNPTITIRASAHGPQSADAALDRGAPLVAVTLADTARTITPAGRRIYYCRHQTEGILCHHCRSCADHTIPIIAFLPHGYRARHVEELSL